MISSDAVLFRLDLVSVSILTGLIQNWRGKAGHLTGSSDKLRQLFQWISIQDGSGRGFVARRQVAVATRFWLYQKLKGSLARGKNQIRLSKASPVKKRYRLDAYQEKEQPKCRAAETRPPKKRKPLARLHLCVRFSTLLLLSRLDAWQDLGGKFASNLGQNSAKPKFLFDSFPAGIVQ